MKKRVFSVAMVLILVISMCVVSGAPIAIAGPVTDLNVTLSTHDANTVAQIVVQFKSTSSGGLSGGDKINIKMPGFVYPATIPNDTVTIDGSNSQSVTINGDTLEIAVASFFGPNHTFTVVITPSAGVKTPQLSQEKNLVYDMDGISGTPDDNLNPSVAALNSYLGVSGDTAPDSFYQIQVTTKKDTFPAVFGNIQIFDWLVMDKLIFGQGDIVNVTGAGFTAGDTLTLNVATNRPLIGSGIVNPDGTVDIQAIVTDELPTVPFQGTDEHGRASELQWPKNTLMTDAAYVISVALMYPSSFDPADVVLDELYTPTGVWQHVPSVDVINPVLPGSTALILGRDWGEVDSITIQNPLIGPPNPVLSDLDDDCYCDPAIFNVPGLMVMNMYIGGDITTPGSVMLTCDTIPQPHENGPGCSDDFMLDVNIPRLITPGDYTITVNGDDQLQNLHIAAQGTITVGGDTYLEKVFDSQIHYLSCMLPQLNPALTKEVLQQIQQSTCCKWINGVPGLCPNPECQFDIPDCTDEPVNIQAAIHVPAPTLEGTPGTVCPGGMVSLEGSGFVPGEDFGIAVIQSGTPIDIATGITVDGQGNFTQDNVMIPLGLDPGTHTITVFFDPTDSTCDSCNGGDPEGDEIAASFEIYVEDCLPPDLCNLVIDSTFGGSVENPGEGAFVYPCNTIIDLEAVADPCYEFVNWSGDTWTILDDNDPNAQITCDVCPGTVTVTANFQHIEYNLNVTSTEGGSVIDPGEGDFLYDCGATVPLEADPDEGYIFNGWTGDAVGTPSQAVTSILMDSNKSVEANFMVDTGCGPEMYDANTNCEIEFDEFIEAFRDYLGKKINIDCMFDVLMVYLTGAFC